jgi:hypothetical protein
MTNETAALHTNLAVILSHSEQVGLITSVHLRKNDDINKKINEEFQEIEKVGKEKKTKESEIKKVQEEFWNKEFEGNLFYVPLADIGNIKGEKIQLANGGVVDVKAIASQIIGTVIIE